MKTSFDESGSVLVITLILCALLGLALGSYLYWVRTQNVLVAESQAWNSALALAEAGIEEGMAQINVLDGTPNVANYQSSAVANFGPLSGGAYGPLTTPRTLANGKYNLIIVPPTNGSLTLGPTITATGYASVPLLSIPVARTVQVTTTIKSLLANTITAVSNVNFSGGNVTIDSYDSSDWVKFPPFGMWNSSNRMAGGDVASLYGLAAIQNATVYGHLEMGPNGTYSINNGQVGDLPQNWAGGPGKIESGWLLTDFNMDVPDVQPPYTGGTGPTSSGGIYTVGGSYYVLGDFTLKNNETLYVAADTTLYVTGNFTMNNNAVITNAPGYKLKLYVGNTNGSSVSINLGMVNITGNDTLFQVYGLPTVTSIVWNGNTAFIGVVYAPEANMSLKGSGTTQNDFQGALTVRSLTVTGGFNIHYDQNLKRFGPLSGYTVSSWREL